MGKARDPIIRDQEKLIDEKRILKISWNCPFKEQNYVSYFQKYMYL
jgi:hypothetical protein